MTMPKVLQEAESILGPPVTRDDWWRHEKELQELRKEIELKEQIQERWEGRIERLRSKYWRWIVILASACGVEIGVILTLLLYS